MTIRRVPSNLAATPEQISALDPLEQRKQAVLALQSSETAQLRASRQDSERGRIQRVREQKATQAIDGVGEMVLTEAGHSRLVRRKQTTLYRMLGAKTLSRDLFNYAQAFVLLVVSATGAAVTDRQDATNRLTAAYEPSAGLTAYGSRTPTDMQLNSVTAFKDLRRRIPEELMLTFLQIIGEETGVQAVRSRTLGEIGEAAGWSNRQANSYGAGEVIAVCSLIKHYMQEIGVMDGKTAAFRRRTREKLEF